MILLLIMAFMLVMPVVAVANSTPSTSSGGTDILSTVTNASSAGSAVDSLQTSAQTAGNSFIKFLRNTAIIIAVIMFVVVAYSLLFSPNVKTIGDAKGRIGALVMAIAISVLAEQIVGTLLSWFGFTVGH
ncbi:MAG: hypothetical protein P4L69_20940 [Desulfosporosinus sp.]|nr:hypothetical protein [Desulfosporosinus sp.]